MNILDRILNSNTTLIGHDTQNGIIVEKLLEFLPSVTLFKSVEVSEIFQHFNSLSHFRDYKLDSLLNDKRVNFVIVDLSTLRFESEGQDSNFNKAKHFRQFIRELQSLLFTLSNTDSVVKFKLILLSTLYASMTQRQPPTIHFGGSDVAIYISDLVLKFLGESIYIEKDRIIDDEKFFNTKQELRKLKIDKLFDEITTKT